MTTPQDLLDTIGKVEELLAKTREKLAQVETALKTAQKSYEGVKDLGVIGQGIVNVTNWILGPAENLLNSQQKMGYDVASAEELRSAHEVNLLRQIIYRDEYSL